MISALHLRLARLHGSHSPLLWTLFAGQLIVSTGRFMVYPFLAIYLNQRLGISLTMVGSLIAVASLGFLLAQIIAGPLVDRYGRRRPLLVAMLLDMAAMLGLAFASNLEMIAVLLFLMGVVGIFDVSVNAMIADVSTPEQRQEAYGLLRVAINAGAALGPAIGGFVAALSYVWAFLSAAAAAAIYWVLILARTWETKPVLEVAAPRSLSSDSGYASLLRDRPYLAFLSAGALMGISYAIPWVLLSVFLKTRWGIPESMFGFLVMINALMVVFFQFPIARWLAHFPKMPALASAATLTAIGAGSIAYFNTYALFVLSMVIITLGELIASPTASAYVANAAPLDMRGRYLAAFGLSWGLAFGLGPILGGWLNDRFGPAAMWQGAMGLGLLSALAFLALGGVVRAPKASAAPGPIE